MTIILLIAGFVLSVILTAMSMALRSLSVSHLRYWSRKGDPVSKKLYPLKARGSATLLTIEIFRSIAISGTIILLAYNTWGGFAWLLGSVVLFLIFIVLVELYLIPVGTRILAACSGFLLWLSHALNFITNPLGKTFDRFIDEQPVTLTRTELVHMLGAVTPGDTDLSADELRIIKHSLGFGEKKVHDIMTPRSVLSTVKEDDVLSPLLLDELHKTGHSRFPVLTGEEERAVGLLYVKDLLDVKASTRVSEIMHSPVHYVNEERELDHVLQAFIKTKQHLFLVVNEFAEITGLITIEDVVEQVLGKPIVDEFDKYDSMREVADARAKVVKKQIKMVK